MSIDYATLLEMYERGATVEELASAYVSEIEREAERKARAVPWAKLRVMAFERDGHSCGYCGSVEGPFEVDHIVPRIKGGENILENVRVACRRCNRSKKDRERPKA